MYEHSLFINFIFLTYYFLLKKIEFKKRHFLKIHLDKPFIEGFSLHMPEVQFICHFTYSKWSWSPSINKNVSIHRYS